jgi:hypothetical protein
MREEPSSSSSSWLRSSTQTQTTKSKETWCSSSRLADSDLRASRSSQQSDCKRWRASPCGSLGAPRIGKKKDRRKRKTKSERKKELKEAQKKTSSLSLESPLRELISLLGKPTLDTETLAL